MAFLARPEPSDGRRYRPLGCRLDRKLPLDTARSGPPGEHGRGGRRGSHRGGTRCAHRAGFGQYGALGGAPAPKGALHAGPRPAQPHPRTAPRGAGDARGGRRRSGRYPCRGRRTRARLPADLRCARLGADRRLPCDQCRRLQRAALRQCTEPVPRPRGSACLGRGARPDDRSAQGQQRARSAPALHRLRGHPRHSSPRRR